MPDPSPLRTSLPVDALRAGDLTRYLDVLDQIIAAARAAREDTLRLRQDVVRRARRVEEQCARLSIGVDGAAGNPERGRDETAVTSRPSESLGGADNSL